MPNKTIRNGADFIHPNLRVCLFLALAILAVYGQVWNHGFINFDDPTYVSDNVYVKDGLTTTGFKWAFGFGDKQNTYWHPLTWLSHMLDVQIHGLAAGRHLLTNVFLHMCNAFLLFYGLGRMTGTLWPSFWVAVLFALHPLNVEAVAWVTERKSVLSTFFWMISLLAYHHYTRRPGPVRYFSVMVSFSLGLMAKPMLITLPLVFLLLDYWPLGRLQPEKSREAGRMFGIRHLIAEKIPFVVLSTASIVVSSLSLYRQENFISLTAVPLGVRIGNALISYVGYIMKMVVPYNLSVFYPYPKILPLWQVAGALIILAGLTAAVIRYHRLKPYLLVGWLWYLGTLVPVLGLVQAGLWPAMADRFVYVPMIGLGIMIAWGAYEFEPLKRLKVLRTTVAVVVVVGLMIVSALQVGYWKNSIALFKKALQADSDNALAHNNLGVALRRQGQIEDAIAHYDRALRIKPDYPAAHHNLGLALMRLGLTDEAVVHFRRALDLKPGFEQARKSLKTALAARAAMTKKIAELQTALERTPENAELHYLLGNLYDRTGDTSKAIEHLRMAVKIRPGFSQALNNLGIVYVIAGDYDEALVVFKRLASLQPHDPVVQYAIASVLARQNKVDESIDWLQSAVGNGFKDRNRILNDPDLAGIRHSRRYQELIRNF